MYCTSDMTAACDIWHFECSTANSPGQDIFGQAQTKEQQRFCNGTLKPLIPLLMHSYKYSTSKNLSCCSPAAPRVCSLGWAYTINTDDGNVLYPMKWSHVKHSLSPLWSSFIQPPLKHNMFLSLWINNGVGSYNIDHDKLHTDCWDNKAMLRQLCGLRFVWEAFVMYGVA